MRVSHKSGQEMKIKTRDKRYVEIKAQVTDEMKSKANRKEIESKAIEMKKSARHSGKSTRQAKQGTRQVYM